MKLIITLLWFSFLIQESFQRYNFLHQIVLNHLNQQQNFQFDESIQPLSNGHLILTQENYSQFQELQKQEHAFILAISSENSHEEKCRQETFLKLVVQVLEQQNFTQNEKDIKIVQINSNHKNLIERQYSLNIDSYTTMIGICKQEHILFKNDFYRENNYFEYKGDLIISQFLNFMHKILNPYVTLTKENQIQQFINPNEDYDEITYQNQNISIMNEIDITSKYRFRALMVLHDRQFDKQIMRRYIEACEKLANREDIRMGYIGDRARVLGFLKKYNEQFQLNGAKNLLLQINSENQYRFIDLEQHRDIDIEEWINRNSIEIVHEIKDLQDVKIVSQIKTPLIILFLDNFQRSKKILNQAQMLYGTYGKNLVFVYITNPKLIDIRHELGANLQSIPSVTIITNKGIIYPFREEYLNTESLDEYVKHFITGRIRPLNNEQFQQTIDTFVEKLLKHTRIITITAFDSTVLQTNDKDLLIFYYSTESDSFANRKSQEIASFIDTTAQRFKDYHFNSVEVIGYDIYRNGLPENMINGIQIPSLYLYPANNKNRPILFNERFHKTRTHMEFLEKYGQTGIKLNERSHLPPRIVTQTDVLPGGQYYDPNGDL